MKKFKINELMTDVSRRTLLEFRIHNWQVLGRKSSRNICKGKRYSFYQLKAVAHILGIKEKNE